MIYSYFKVYSAQIHESGFTKEQYLKQSKILYKEGLNHSDSADYDESENADNVKQNLTYYFTKIVI